MHDCLREGEETKTESLQPEIKPLQEFNNRLLTITSPNYVGGYRLGKQKLYSVLINLTYKPNWFHRQFMRIFLGWYWENKNEK